MLGSLLLGLGTAHEGLDRKGNLGEYRAPMALAEVALVDGVQAVRHPFLQP